MLSGVVRRRVGGPLPEAKATGDPAEDFAPLVEGQRPHEGFWSTLPALAWALLGLACALGIATLVLVALDYANDKDSQILSAIATLQSSVDACCEAIQAALQTISTALTDLATSIASLTTIAGDTLTNTETLLGYECQVLAVPAFIDAPGCYVMLENLTCDVVGDVCVYVVDTQDVTIYGNGFSMYVDPTTVAFGVYFAEHVRIYDVSVWTGAPSNDSNSRAVDAFAADDLLLSGLVVTNLFRPIANVFSNHFAVLGSTIANANAYNYVGFGNRVISMVGVQGAVVRGCTFRNNNVGGFFDGHSYGVSVVSQSGAPSVGTTVEDCIFIDTHIKIVANNEGDLVSGVVVRGCTFAINDPTFPDNFIGIGDEQNATLSGLVRGVVVEDCVFEANAVHPGFDGLYIHGGVTDLRISRNTLAMSANGFALQGGVVNTAIIHVGLRNTGLQFGLDAVTPCNNVLIEDNQLSGAAGADGDDPVAQTQRRSTIGIMIEAGCTNVVVRGNDISAIGAGRPAAPCVAFDNCTEECSAWPAQHPAGIYVDAGARLFSIVGNAIRDGACPDGNVTTIAPDGIVVAGAYNASSFCPDGYGPVQFPDADDGYIAGNSVSQMCGAGVKNFGGPGTRVWNNHAWNNGFFNFLTGPNAFPTIVSFQGDPALAGANLENILL